MSAASALDTLNSSASLSIGQVQAQAKSAAANAADGSNKRLSREEIHKTAVDFETSFLAQMYKHMFEDVGNDEVFGGGAGEESFKSFMIDEYAKLTAKSGRIGLSQQIEAQMLKFQEVTS